MIQYYENIPFCIMQPEEAGVHINCHEIVKFLEYVEPQICSIPNDKNTVYKNDDLSARFNQWNIFLYTEPVLLPVYKLIKTGWDQFAKEVGFAKDPLWIHAHGNLHRKDQKLDYHAHLYPVLGYVGISSEGSNTTFYAGENEDIAIPIPNKNGQLVITLGPIPHHTDVWDKDYSRCSIAFNLMTTQETQNLGCGPVFPFEV
tara:strand:+ start:5 stop:607 length:603 start_codon:yes stop_codon:yes gene_type:complete